MPGKHQEVPEAPGSRPNSARPEPEMIVPDSGRQKGASKQREERKDSCVSMNEE